jgi:hypothetical protein
MKKIGICIFIGIIVCATLFPIVHAGDVGIVADQQLITISPTDKGLLVEEDIKVTNNDQANATLLRFWIQQDANDVMIAAKQSGMELVPLVTGYVRACNLTEANLTIHPTKSLSIQITYYLPSTAEIFEQTLLYDTTLFTVTYNDQTLFQGEHLLSAVDTTNTLQIRLYKPTEAPLSMVTIIIIFVIAVVVLGALLFVLKRQRSKTKKSSLVESEEMLSTKKSLLLSLLKDLEKQYRAKSISDETYTKLKDEYKQQAIDTMKRLEDIKK